MQDNRNFPASLWVQQDEAGDCCGFSAVLDPH